jgi:acetoacetyl-CoA synthetase
VAEALWKPDKWLKEQSSMQAFLRWLDVKRGLLFRDHQALWEWSVRDLEGFWGNFWMFAKIRSHSGWDRVVEKTPDMMGTRWFTGATVNYAEHIFRKRSDAFPAICFTDETGLQRDISWKELEEATGRLAYWMKERGISKGDRVVSVMPNIPETVIAFLAAQSIGAVWSSCSPDFGIPAILERFEQIEPKLLFATDGYRYNGKWYAKKADWKALADALPGLQEVVIYGEDKGEWGTSWNTIQSGLIRALHFEPLPFDHPLWILYSSGTTGKPKAIVHSVGGNLIEHLKVLLLHWDVKPGERFFWYSTTGWMMWNFSVASLLAGATLMLYDGSPGYPDMNRLWDWVVEQRIQHFGGGAAFFIASMKTDDANRKRDYSYLRTIGSTGSPLPPDVFRWIYARISEKVWLISFSGGTDICSGFVGGHPFLPVYAGEIQCRLLGVALEAWNEEAMPVVGEMGEMVIREPMPSMPLGFWKDEGNVRYRESYFSMFPGVWRHGDWIEVTKRGGVIIYGRSDATLNRDGVRIGTAEIYNVVEKLPEIQDSIVVCVEKPGGRFYMPLFVKLKPGFVLTDALKKTIKQTLRMACSPRHVPDEILAIDVIPYTASGKKKEKEMKERVIGHW